MIDAQTRRSVETMCLCGLDLEGLKGCFPKIEEEILEEIYIATNNRNENSNNDLRGGISCNCS